MKIKLQPKMNGFKTRVINIIQMIVELALEIQTHPALLFKIMTAV